MRLRYFIHRYFTPYPLIKLFPIFSLFLLILAPSAYSDEVTLSWDPSSGPEVAGYKTHYGTSSRNYDACVDVGNCLSCTISGLQEGATYYIAVTAYDIQNIESDYSDEVVYTVPYAGEPGPSSTVIPQQQMSIVSVDSEELTGEPGAVENLIDGRDDTLWHTEWYYFDPKHPHEIIINLGDIFNVLGFRYLPRQDGWANGTVADYAFYVSNDGAFWGQSVADGTFNSNTAEKEVTFPGKIGQYIRFVALSEIEGNPWTSMAEINILGSDVN